MKTSDLINFFNGVISGDDLRSLIIKESSNYETLMKKEGSTIPMIFEEDENVFIGNDSLKRLLSETLFGPLTNIDLAYICDNLTMGENVEFENQSVQNIVFEFADPEINGGYKTSEEIKNILQQIG